MSQGYQMRLNVGPVMSLGKSMVAQLSHLGTQGGNYVTVRPNQVMFRSSDIT